MCNFEKHIILYILYNIMYILFLVQTFILRFKFHKFKGDKRITLGVGLQLLQFNEANEEEK